MALNRVRDKAEYLSLPVPVDTESGDPLVIGDLPCVALTDRNSEGESTVQTNGSFAFSITAGADIDVGDILYLTGGGAFTHDPSGNDRFGYALEAIANGNTATIEVKIGY